jgi:hypothetical protein
MSIMADSIRGPGLAFVRSRIAESAKTVLDEQTFLHWYDDEFLADVVTTSGVRSGFRYIDVHKTSPCGDKTNPKPYLAFYPMEDLAFALSDEFRNIRSQSEQLPGSGVVYDFADMDVSYLGLKGKTKRTNGGEVRPAKFLITCGIRPSQAPLESAMTSFFSEQTSLLEQTPGFVRSSTFHLLYAQTNDQSRTSKDMSTTPDDANFEPPTWLAIHEFDEQPNESLTEYIKWGVKELGTGLRQAGRELDSEVYIWSLAKVHGEGNLFD